MPVESKKYHIFPHITVSLLLHLTVLMFLIAAIILSAEYRPDITLIIAIPISVLFAIMFLLLNVFFWNSVVTIDLNGMRQRRGFHVYTWRWDEITGVKCRIDRPWPLNTTAATAYSPKLIFISSAHEKKLSVVMERYTRKVLFLMCPDEGVKKECRRLLEACNFVYLK